MTIQMRTVLVASFLFASLAFADQLTSEAFAKKAVTTGLAEVQLANIAIQKTQNPAVRAFAESLVAYYSHANSELKTIATQAGVVLSRTPSSDATAVADALSQKAGPVFDRLYAAQIVRDQEEAVARYCQKLWIAVWAYDQVAAATRGKRSARLSRSFIPNCPTMERLTCRAAARIRPDSGETIRFF